MAEGGHRKGGGRGQRPEPGRGGVHMVPVGAPDPGGLRRVEPLEEEVRVGHGEIRSTVFPGAGLHRPPGLPGDELHPVADPQDGKSQLEEFRVDPRDAGS
jgi:hypothetical protein